MSWPQLIFNSSLLIAFKRLPEPYKTESFSKKILVLGGGVTGMSAALDAAKTGYAVTIVEKTDKLGGYAADMRSQMPVTEPFEELRAPIVNDLIAEVGGFSNIDVRTSTEVARIAGQPGEFTVTFKKPGEKISFDVPFPLPEEMLVDEDGKDLNVEDAHAKYLEYNEGREDILQIDPDGELYGAVVLAAGWRPAKIEGEEYAHLGVDLDDVVTNDEFEKIAAKGKILRPSDGKEAKNVVFIQSPGKDEDDIDFEYCGSVTSQVALKQAKYVREDYSDGKAYIIYQHMRTPGLQEYFYKSLQQDDGIFMTKGAVTQVAKQGNGLAVTAVNTLLGENLAIKADMVVVAGGMVPVTADDPVINLAYRQGPGFRDNDLFGQYADSNYICFPYETQRTGIYAAGAIRRAMTIEESIEDATGAAMKAIQCIESSNRGMAVHPRSGDMTYPEFFFQRCTQCKRCTVECPFGALDDDEKGTSMANPTRCRRCGTCMGACPERIISFADYTIDSIGSQVKAIGVPSEDDYDEPPFRFLALICENDAFPALDMVGLNRMDYSPNVRFIPIRCLGSFNVIWIKDALAQGMDGVILIGCKHGDDYQCHFMKGSELAETRVKKIGDALSSLAPEESPFPRKEMIAASWGLKDRLIKNGDIWLCHQCGDCTDLCPRGAAPGDVLSAVRAAAITEYARPKILANAINDPKKLPFLIGIPALWFALLAYITMAHGDVMTRIFDGFGIAWSHAHKGGEHVIAQADFFSTWFVDLTFVPTATAVAIIFILSLKNFLNDIHENAVLEGKTDKITLNYKEFFQALIRVIPTILKHDKFNECESNKDRATPHMMVLYSFIGLFIVTSIGFVLLYVAQSPGPYSQLNPMKWLANISGVALVIGGGLMIKNRLDKKDDQITSYKDWFILVLVFSLGLTGMLTAMTYAEYSNRK